MRGRTQQRKPGFHHASQVCPGFRVQFQWCIVVEMMSGCCCGAFCWSEAATDCTSVSDLHYGQQQGPGTMFSVSIALPEVDGAVVGAGCVPRPTRCSVPCVSCCSAWSRCCDHSAQAQQHGTQPGRSMATLLCCCTCAFHVDCVAWHEVGVNDGEGCYEGLFQEHIVCKGGCALLCII
jgi:hypothetical protein